MRQCDRPCRLPNNDSIPGLRGVGENKTRSILVPRSAVNIFSFFLKHPILYTDLFPFSRILLPLGTPLGIMTAKSPTSSGGCSGLPRVGGHTGPHPAQSFTKYRQRNSEKDSKFFRTRTRPLVPGSHAKFPHVKLRRSRNSERRSGEIAETAFSSKHCLSINTLSYRFFDRLTVSNKRISADGALPIHPFATKDARQGEQKTVL